MSNVGNNIEPPEQPVKVTILLPIDTVNKIDQIAQIAGFGSRGRTIQALFDTLSTSQIDISNILNLFNQFTTRGADFSREEQWAFATALIVSTNALIIRLNQFLGLKPMAVAQQKRSKKK